LFFAFLISQHIFLRFIAIAQEKTEEELKSGIEGFDKEKLKHQETEEKNPLPDQSGMLSPRGGRGRGSLYTKSCVGFPILT
jgi:hypothetical protein